MRSATYARAIEVANRGVRTHYVYFLLAKREPSACGQQRPSAVKIGTSHDPDRRLAELRNDPGTGPDWLASECKSLTYLGFIVGDSELERLLHRSFTDERIAGEWFNYGPLAHHIDDLLRKHCVCRGCQTGGTLAHL